MNNSATNASAGNHSRYPTAGYAWYMVILLTLAYICSFIDRFMLGLLVEPIKADLGFSDTQLGLLLGPAFAIFYATMGLPLGWMADRYRRGWIVAIGITVWSAATIACGLVKNFLQMFIARMSVGIGEATLSPCAISMISDSFPPERRAKPIAFYSMAISIGAAIASLFSATVLIWAKSSPETTLPLVGVVAPWQFAFIVVGLPGFILALMFFTLREPRRQDRGLTEGLGNASLVDTLKFILQRWQAFASFLTIFCLMTTVAYSQGWSAALFMRTWGWEASRFALVNGLVLLAIGPAMVNLAGWWCDRWYAAGTQDAALRIAAIGAFIMVVTGVIAPLMPTGELAMVMFALNAVGMAITTATGVTALLNMTPGEIRAQVVAFYYMAISLAGLLLGPTTIGILNDQVFGEAGLKYSMALLPFVYGLPVLLLVPVTLRLYARTCAELRGEG
ncbi:MAG: MFS transporter [Gammaproteobacteria bacterium]|nr:MFS transporter [Gammaproteobacteria bacterium]MCY4209858.1 MFS transporter [Gammaproteobacteria bacterium]MCY4337335.1 MFS transporter [Gammaproteobacteria bacterium]